MKKVILLLFTAIFSIGISAQNAVNFNCNDCNNVNHDLFSELNSGSVIVLCWVMPCSACSAPAISAATLVQSYASSYPGIVKFYLSDESGNTPCSSLATWSSSNSLHPDATFSDSVIRMTDYGSPGMPKIVVLGGGISHSVFFDNEGPLIDSLLQIGIDNALAATGIINNGAGLSNINLFPNPAQKGKVVLNYNLSKNSSITIDIYNTLGVNVKSIANEEQIAGEQKITLDVSDLSCGVYFIHLKEGESAQTIRFIVIE